MIRLLDLSQRGSAAPRYSYDASSKTFLSYDNVKVCESQKSIPSKH
jgi:hypothetical protein